MQELINQIEEKCNVYFLNTDFKLFKKSNTQYIISGTNLSNAINNYRKDKNEIKVLKWFDDYWLYFEINFIPHPDTENQSSTRRRSQKKIFPSTFITISIFQGEDSDQVKVQLFRAEWDNYDGNKDHPQPHWHVYPVLFNPKTVEDFEAFNELSSSQTPSNSFEAKVNSDKKPSKTIDITGIHFAMNAQWAENKHHIHSISEEITILNWLSGVLAHIKCQLEYVKS